MWKIRRHSPGLVGTEFSWLLANPIFACKDALHNRDDDAMFMRSQGSSYGTS